MSQTKAQLISDLVQALNFTGTSSAPANGAFLSAANTLALATNSAQRLTIDSSGNVGIGTNSPASLLHVDGDITIKDASPSILFDDDSGVPQSPDYRIQVNTGAFVINDETNNVVRFKIASSGNIGIGTTSPDTLLDVSSSDDAVIRIQSEGSDATDDARLEIKTTNGQFTIQNDRSLGTSGALTFAGNSTNYLVIDHANGNVGIGTASPSTKFEVQTAASERIQFLSNGSNEQPRIDLIRDSGTDYSIINAIAAYQIKKGSNLIYQYANDTHRFSIDGSEKARIDSSGNLGIGTTGPSAKLHAADTAATVACLQRTSSTANVVLRFQNDTSSMFCGLTSNATGFGIDDDNDLGNGPMFFVSRSNGRVGIGEATPQTHLHVRGTSNVGLRLDDSGQSYGNIIYNNGQNSTDALTIAVDEGNTQAASTMRFRVDASEKMRIDSDGQLALGVTSTSAKCHIHGTNTELIRLSAPGDASNVNQFGIGFVFSASQTNPAAKIEVEEVDASDNRGHLVFSTRGVNSDSAPTERFHIKADGRCAVGTNATPNTAAAITSNYLQATTGQGMIGIVTNQTAHPNDTSNVAAQARSVNGATTRNCYIGTRKVGTNNPAGFLYIQQRDGGNTHIWADNSAKIRTGNDVASVGGTGGTVVGTQTSDIRLKNNLGSVSYGLTEINKITPIKFTFKKDESNRQQIGFSAQDLQSIIPESVYDTLETVEIEGTENKNILAMEYVSLIPVLVNAVKELSAKVAVLEAS